MSYLLIYLWQPYVYEGDVKLVCRAQKELQELLAVRSGVNHFVAELGQD